jgi:exonuclease SbcC
MKILLNNLQLTNFKGIRSLSIDFGDTTSIYGANATGKSTIADAWFFLLFGKNTSDQSNFEIKTLDEHNQVISRIDHEVTGAITIDGVPTTLRRVFKEKWVKKQGSAETVFSGHETLFFINDVPKQLNEYQAFINSNIPESTFKLLTLPGYFNSLKKEERRAMLTGIAVVPTDDELAGKDLANVLNIMRTERKSLSDLKKQYAAQKAGLKAELALIPARIDEVERAIVQAASEDDFTLTENRIKDLKEDIAVCDSQIEDKSKGVQDQIKIRSNVMQKKGELNDRLTNMGIEARKKFSEQAGSNTNTVSLIQQNIRFKENRIADLNDEVKRIKGLIEYLTTENGKLRDQVTNVNKEVFDASAVTTTCPTCKQSLPEGDINSQVEKMSASFNQDKANRIAEINRKGLANKQTIDNHQKAIDNLVKQTEELQAEIAPLQVQLTEIESTPVATKTVEQFLTENPEYEKTKQELADLVLPEVAEVDTTELKSKKAQLQSELESEQNALQRILSSKATIEAQKQRKQQLLESESKLSQELSLMEGFEFQITEFTNRKMKAVETSVNKMFPTVRFKMFEVLVNGGIAETCETLINGVPYSDCNNAGRINAGLEIISVFSQILDTYVPCFVDNSEAANYLYQLESQMIKLFVTTDKVLKVTS